MNEYTQSIRDEVDGVVRQYEYDDRTVIVADFGFVDGSVDVVDGTAIVVIEPDQYEFEVPDAVDSAIMNNGVVTIDMER